MTPAAVVKLLQFMYRSPHRENWIGLLPIGGEDGTLQTRLRNTTAAGRIHAKTGSLTHVNSLSGYAERADGSMLAFSFLTNNQGAPSAEIRAVLDKLCVAMTALSHNARLAVVAAGLQSLVRVFHLFIPLICGRIASPGPL